MRSFRSRLRHTIPIVLAVMVMAAVPWQETPVPVEAQVQLLQRIWAYDRSHAARLSDDLVIGVVFQAQVRPSLLVKEAFEDAARQMSIEGVNVRVVAIDYQDSGALAAQIEAHGVDIAYVAPLRAVDVGDLATATRSAGVLSCTGVPDYVDQGLTVGIELRDGSAGILINRAAERAEGAAFQSQLLKLARLVEEGP